MYSHSHSYSHRRGFCLWVGVALGLASALALAATPEARNLSVEFRQISEADQSGAVTYSAGSERDTPQWEPQTLLVRNGEKAGFRLHDAIPMQWVQSVGTQTNANAAATSPANAASAASNGASLTQALAWFDAGQNMAVQVHWSAGKPYASVQIEVQREDVGQRVGADLPRQGRATVSTTVLAPLAQWVTIASSGKAASAAGVYRSDPGAQQQRMLQVRVMIP
jgi:hypothetical protein